MVPPDVLAAVWAKFSDDVEIPEDLAFYVEEQMDCTLKNGPQRERTGTRDLVGCPTVRSDMARWPHPGRPTQPCWTPMEGHSSLSISGRTPAKGKHCPHPSSSGPTPKVSESSIGSLEGRRSVCFAQPPGVVTAVK